MSRGRASASRQSARPCAVPGGREALIEGPNHGVVRGGRDGGHVERPTDAGAPAPDGALPRQWPLSQCRARRRSRRRAAGGPRAHSGRWASNVRAVTGRHRCQARPAPAMGTGGDLLRQVVVDVLQRPLQLLAVATLCCTALRASRFRCVRPPAFPAAGAAAPRPAGRPAPRPAQGGGRAASRRRRRPGPAHGSDRSWRAAHWPAHARLPRIDHCHREAGPGERRRHRRLIATRRFYHHHLRLPLHQRRTEHVASLGGAARQGASVAGARATSTQSFATSEPTARCTFVITRLLAASHASCLVCELGLGQLSDSGEGPTHGRGAPAGPRPCAAPDPRAATIAHWTSSRATSNTSVALPGTAGGAPAEP